MKRRALGLVFLAVGGALVSLAAAACEDTSVPESPGQKIPPQGAFAGEGGVTEGGEASACKAGPPSTGLLTVSQGVHSGKHASITIDDRGLPVAVQARVIAPDNTVLELFRWDSTCGRFGTATLIDTIGSQTPNGRQIAIALDTSTGSIGVAYHAIIGPIGGTHHEELRYAQLKKNASTFEAAVRVEDGTKPASVDHIVDTPGLAMASGKVFVAYREPQRLCTTSADCDSVLFRTRDVTGAWSAELNLSDPTNIGTSTYGGARDASIQVAVDSDGLPGVAWVAFSNTAPIKGTVAFIRPADATPAPAVVMQGADGVTTDVPDVSLAYDGKKPRVAAILHTTADFATTGNTEWFIASDDGTSWATPIALPHDMNSSLDGYISLSIGPSSKVGIVSASNADDGTSMFGQPKIITAPDVFTFSIGGVPKATFSQVANWATGVYDASGKLNIVMQGPDQAANPSQVGLLYFHE